MRKNIRGKLRIFRDSPKMCGCFSSVKYWEVNTKAGQNDKCYSIRIQKPFGCSSAFALYVNNEVISQNLPLKNYSPFYRIGGQFGWEQDNNFFLIVRDSIIFAAFSKKYRLFVNRFETESGLEFTEFWKHRGWQHVFVGICILALCVGMALMLNYVDQKALFLTIDIILAVFAVIMISFGVFLIIFKHKNTGDVYKVEQAVVNKAFEDSTGQDKKTTPRVPDVFITATSSC